MNLCRQARCRRLAAGLISMVCSAGHVARVPLCGTHGRDALTAVGSGRAMCGACQPDNDLSPLTVEEMTPMLAGIVGWSP